MNKNITNILVAIVATLILVAMFSCSPKYRSGCESTYGKVGYGNFKPIKK